jgi:hypothetical protein
MAEDSNGPKTSGAGEGEAGRAGGFLEKLREIRRRRTDEAIDRILKIVLAAVVTVEVVVIGFCIYHRWDLTLVGAFTVSEKTVKILDELEEPVDILVFYSGSYPPHQWAYTRVRDLLEAYERASDRIALRFVDPYRKRESADLMRRKYGISEVDFAQGVVVFTYKGQSKFITDTQIVQRRPSPMSPGPGKEEGFTGEEAFLAAILSLVEGKKPVAYVASGHREYGLEDTSMSGFAAAADRLRRDNFDVRPFVFRGREPVPRDCDLLILPGPKEPFTKEEALGLRNYLDEGGRALFLLQPELDREGRDVVNLHLGPVLDGFGIEVVDHILIDPRKPMVPQFLLNLSISDYDKDHPITRPLLGLSGNREVDLPVVRPVVPVEKIPEGLSVVPIAFTPKHAALKADIRDIFDQQKLEHLRGLYGGPVHPTRDKVGRVPVAVAAEKTGVRSDRRSRVVAIGNCLFVSAPALQGQPYNVDLFLNAANWLTERETHLGIEAKKPREVVIRIPARKMNHIFWLVVILMPLGALSLGTVVWLTRRK